MRKGLQGHGRKQMQTSERVTGLESRKEPQLKPNLILVTDTETWGLCVAGN